MHLVSHQERLLQLLILLGALGLLTQDLQDLLLDHVQLILQVLAVAGQLRRLLGRRWHKEEIIFKVETSFYISTYKVPLSLFL
jgi:hypothetical protein